MAIFWAANYPDVMTRARKIAVLWVKFQNEPSTEIYFVNERDFP